MLTVQALAAIERSILLIIFHLLDDPAATYRDLGAHFYTKRVDTAPRAARLVGQPQPLDHHVSLTPAA